MGIVWCKDLEQDFFRKKWNSLDDSDFLTLALDNRFFFYAEESFIEYNGIALAMFTYVYSSIHFIQLELFDNKRNTIPIIYSITKDSTNVSFLRYVVRYSKVEDSDVIHRIRREKIKNLINGSKEG